jgi:hypothetical protein
MAAMAKSQAAMSTAGSTKIKSSSGSSQRNMMPPFGMVCGYYIIYTPWWQETILAWYGV